MADHAVLAVEHPTLYRVTADLVATLGAWREQIRSLPEGSAWMHHSDFAERTEKLAGHLKAVLLTADAALLESAMALARVALEHHVVDRLLLLADRYIVIAEAASGYDLEQLETDWDQRVEPWTHDVDSVSRTRNGKALRLVRSGHSVKDDKGVEREQISPYWPVLEHFDAFAGHPDTQAAVLRPFDEPEQAVVHARRNQTMYSEFLKWKSLCDNLQLNGLADADELIQIQVHYSFLSAFVHPSRSGYETSHRGIRLNGPSSEHVLSEIALLYVVAIAAAQVKSWHTYVGRRTHLLAALAPEVLEQVETARRITGYFWFLHGGPTPLDFVDEANRRAHPYLTRGERPAVTPDQLGLADVGYYANPIERLARLHVGEREMMTGFGFNPLWAELHW